MSRSPAPGALRRVTSSYMIGQITDEDHGSQVTLEDGETYFMARLRHDRMHRHVDAAGGGALQLRAHLKYFVP